MTTFVNVFDQLATVAVNVRKAPSTTLRRMYVKAFRDWCAETQWLRQTVTGATIDGTQTYSLGSDPYLEIVNIRAMSGVATVPGSPSTFAIVPGDSSGWDPNNQPMQPRQYAYLPEAQFALWPIPDAVYNLTVSVILQPKDGVAQVPAEPLRKFSSGIEAGALMHLLRIPGQPWSDPNMAEKYEKIWNSCVSNGKADVQRAYNTGSMRARPRAFVVGR